MASSSGAQPYHQALDQLPALLSVTDNALHYVFERLDVSDFQHGLPWFDCEYYPGPGKKGRVRRKRKQRVKLAMAKNSLNKKKVKDPRLQWLPAELLENITNRLERDDILCMGAACQELRAKFPPISRNDQLRLLLRLYVERYKNMADRELSQDQSLASEVDVLCTLCLALHPRKAFSTAELKKSPYDRVCRGAEKDKLQACEHETPSFMQLFRHFEGNAELEICADAAHQFKSNEFSPEHFRPKIKRRPIDDAGILLFRRGFVVNFDMASYTGMGSLAALFQSWAFHVHNAGLIEPTLNDVLVNMDAYVCPHLRTSDPHLWRHESKKPKELLHEEFALKDGWDAYGDDEKARFAICGEPDCETRFGHTYVEASNWLPNIFNRPTALVFQVWRKFPVQDVRDERWLAQLESA